MNSQLIHNCVLLPVFRDLPKHPSKPRQLEATNHYLVHPTFGHGAQFTDFIWQTVGGTSPLLTSPSLLYRDAVPHVAHTFRALRITMPYPYAATIPDYDVNKLFRHWQEPRSWHERLNQLPDSEPPLHLRAIARVYPDEPSLKLEPFHE